MKIWRSPEYALVAAAIILAGVLLLFAVAFFRADRVMTYKIVDSSCGTPTAENGYVPVPCVTPELQLCVTPGGFGPDPSCILTAQP